MCCRSTLCCTVNIAVVCSQCTASSINLFVVPVILALKHARLQLSTSTHHQMCVCRADSSGLRLLQRSGKQSAAGILLLPNQILQNSDGVGVLTSVNTKDA
jgi:hypothetical protein